MRAEGATAATIGIIEGVIRVGLTSDELDHLARSKSPLKVSRRDLPYVISKVREVLLLSQPKISNLEVS